MQPYVPAQNVPAVRTSTPPEPPPAPVVKDSPANDRDPDSDRRPPALESLAFDPPEITDGSVAVLHIRVSDDLSGVKMVTGNMRSPSGAAILSFQALGEEGGVLFTARTTIPARAESGIWYLANLYVTDRADNTLIDSFSVTTVPEGGRLSVVSAESDSKPPEVRNIWVDKASLEAGQKNPVHIDVVDDRSGVGDVSGAFQSPSATALVWFLARKNADTGVWEGDFTVPENADCGEWKLSRLRVADLAHNIAMLGLETPTLSRVTFNVSGSGQCDSEAPVLDGISLAPTEVANDVGGEITVTAQVHDEGTGTLSIIGWAAGPVATNGQIPKISFSCANDGRTPGTPWVGRLTVPRFAAKGQWKIGYLRLMDKAQNTREYTFADPMLGNTTFQVD